MAVAAAIYVAPQHVFAADPCAFPEELNASGAALPHMATSLQQPGHSLAVLTVGSATVFSPGDAMTGPTLTAQALGTATPNAAPPVPSDAGFPMQMAANLRRLYPDVPISVTIRGGRGISANDMLDILRTELKARHFDLVIWQTGTVEAVRNVSPAGFYQTLSDGAALVADADADLILVDPQYSRFLHANADIDPYEQTLQTIAAQPGVALFHRFDLMRYWAGEGQIDLERATRPQRQNTAELLHVCLGRALGAFIVAASKQQS